jgi:hypothetical protein
VAAAALAALFIGACSGASPSEEATPKPTPTAEASQGGTLPSLAPGAGELEGILPDEVGGITLTYQSVNGYGGDSGEVTPELRDFFDRTGTRLEDVTVAVGVGFDQAAGGYLSIFATQVPGADEETLKDEFRKVLENADNVLTETTIAGKDVLAVATAGQDPYGIMYVHDDILFLVRGSTPELSEEALSLLP